MRGRGAPAELESAARQLGYALEQSADTPEAFRKLYAAADPDQQPALQRLEALLHAAGRGDLSRPRGESSAWPTLAWVLQQSPEPERAAAPVLAAFLRQQQFNESVGGVARREFVGFLTYLSVVLGALIASAGMFSILMLPAFASLYRGVGAELPALTAFVFGPGSYLLGLLILLAASAAVFFSWFVVCLGRRLRRQASVPAFLLRVPLAGRVAAAHERHLWLSLASCLNAGRVAADRALTLAGERVHLPDAAHWNDPTAPAMMRDLKLASRLGKLEEEIEFQRHESAAALLGELVRCRRRLRVVLSFVIYLLVAICVAAMYEPIFSLGTAI